jgi:tetratricopeptide (TPR) repeat protein
MTPAALALVLAAAAAAQEGGRLYDGPPLGPAEWYVQLANRYRSGDHVCSVSEPLAPEKVLFELSQLRRLAEAVQRCPNCPERKLLERFPFEAAILMHTERALEHFEHYDTAAPAELNLAPRLADLMPEDRRRAFEPRWLRTAAQLLFGEGQWDAALGLLDAAVARYPTDALLLLTRGAGLESQARLDEDSVRSQEWLRLRGLPRDRKAEDRAAVRKQFETALSAYRKALELQPALHPARLRMGRVLQLLGRHDASIADLRAVAASATDTRERYLSHLFLGHAHEAGGRFAEARAEYEQAVSLEPDGQAAAVALSHALHRGGRSPEAVEALRSGVARAGRRAVVDPWWPYLAGKWEDPAELLATLREEAAR